MRYLAVCPSYCSDAKHHSVDVKQWHNCFKINCHNFHVNVAFPHLRPLLAVHFSRYSGTCLDECNAKAVYSRQQLPLLTHCHAATVHCCTTAVSQYSECSTAQDLSLPSPFFSAKHLAVQLSSIRRAGILWQFPFEFQNCFLAPIGNLLKQRCLRQNIAIVPAQPVSTARVTAFVRNTAS